jgi:hypothetical protein
MPNIDIEKEVENIRHIAKDAVDDYLDNIYRT